ncbi:MAG: hypothetical protein ACP5XB_10245 [Isosphaeraceae bacterium]
MTSVPDAELLDRFAQLRDEAALEALLNRHGPESSTHSADQSPQGDREWFRGRSFRVYFLVLTSGPGVEV